MTDARGYRTAQEVLDSGRAAQAFEAIVDAQGRRPDPVEAGFRHVVEAPHDGRVREIDCLEMNPIARLAGSPANESAGLWLLRGVGDVVARGEPIFEIHAQSAEQLEYAREYVDHETCAFRFGY